MSRDGLLPSMFGRVHPRFRTPHLSTILTGAIVAVAAGLLPLTTLSQLVSMGTLLAFTLACIGIIILRRTSPSLERPFRTPGMPWVPLLGALTCVIQMVGLPWETWARLVVWLVLGMVVYVAYGRSHAAALRENRVLQPVPAD
jgi:APA family basic amino acid/polyamine antiporter